jgi:hypothetical protein
MTAPNPQPIEFPLAQKVLTDYLSVGVPQAMLASVPDPLGNTPLPVVVSSEVPAERPPRLILLFTAPTAGPQSLVLSTRRIICQVDNGSEFATALLTEKVRALIVNAKYQRLGIKEVKVIGEPAKFPGPSVPWRWQFTADVMVRAIAGAWS